MPTRDSTFRKEHAMKYICLVYVEEKILNALPKPERKLLSDEHGLLRKTPESRPAAGGITSSSGRDSYDGPEPGRKSFNDRRAICRNQGATGRISHDRCTGPERCHPYRLEFSGRSHRQHRGTSDERIGLR